VNGITGPVRNIVASPRFLDISLAPDTFFTLPVPDGHTAIAYITGGEGTFDAGEGHRVQNRDLVLFSRGSSIWTRSFGKGMRFLLISGKPTGEPVAWRGPIVMNTREELRQAFLEYRNGTFIKTTAE
jgi:redox-sensitive bicupin YhaK (pirin superfamily)